MRAGGAGRAALLLLPPELQEDHYIPHWIWPGWDVDNLVLACEGCNSAKGGALPWPLVWLLLAEFPRDGWELAA